MAETSIAWCDFSFNPWIGCQKVSEACDNCYAEAYDKRFHGERWGPHAVRTRTSDANWRKPFGWNRKAAETQVRPRVFCASLADVFDNHRSINPNWRQDLWYMIRETPHLDWLLLTKRPQNIPKFIPDDWGPGYPNVWLGTTVENQTEAERRLPLLLNVSAKVHFVSAEPLLGPLDLSKWMWPVCASWRGGHHSAAAAIEAGAEVTYERQALVSAFARFLGWTIAGGESGSGFRPTDPDWFRFLRDQCVAAEVPFFFKQYGGKTRKEIDAKGRLLDGVLWNEFPTPGGT